MKRWKGSALLSLVLLMIGVAVQAQKGSVPTKNEGWRITYGQPKAKVTVEAFYPIEVGGGTGHEWVKDYARQLVAANPRRVRVVVYDFASPKGGEVWQSRGLTCGAFLINGKTQVKHKGKTLTFMRSPTLSGWTVEQLKAAVAGEVERVYGKKSARPARRATSRGGGAPLVARGMVEISVPCGLAGPYGEIVRLFHARYRGVHVRPAVNGVVALLNQLRDGVNRSDIYLALGTYEVERLMAAGRLVKGSMVKCARIPLAIIVPKRNPAGVSGIEDLTSPDVKTIATYSYQLSGGRGARQALERAGLWNTVSDKVVTPKVPDQCKQMVKQGKAQAAVVYRTCLMESYVPDQPPVLQPGLLAIPLPQDLYDPIYVGGVLVTGARNPVAARLFVRFLASPEAKRVWRKWGFEPV